MSNARSPRLVLSITMGTSPSERSCCSCCPDLRVAEAGAAGRGGMGRRRRQRQSAGGDGGSGGKALPWVFVGMAGFRDTRAASSRPNAPQAAAQGAAQGRQLRQQS